MPNIGFGKTVKQTRPTFTVTNQLAAGKYRFRLVVVDTAGNVSKPNDLIVTIRPKPQVDTTAAILAARPRGDTQINFNDFTVRRPQ